jgi:hypothetical protein
MYENKKPLAPPLQVLLGELADCMRQARFLSEKRIPIACHILLREQFESAFEEAVRILRRDYVPEFLEKFIALRIRVTYLKRRLSSEQAMTLLALVQKKLQETPIQSFLEGGEYAADARPSGK